MEKLDRFYSVAELSELLGISNCTIYRMINRGKLKKTKIGKLTRFKRSDVEAFLTSVSNEPIYCPAMGEYIQPSA